MLFWSVVLLALLSQAPFDWASDLFAFGVVVGLMQLAPMVLFGSGVKAVSRCASRL